jgi:hypothetical protein
LKIDRLAFEDPYPTVDDRGCVGICVRRFSLIKRTSAANYSSGTYSQRAHKPDQLRSAVRGPDRYEPDINATYLDMAQHYGVTVIPARPRKPKDKAKVEGAVLIVQRWVLARLRRRRFFSLDELNQAIWELLEELNGKPFQKLEGCRRTAFEKLDRPALRALPPLRYEFADRRNDVGVNIDYHVEFNSREVLLLRESAGEVEIALVLPPESKQIPAGGGLSDVWRQVAEGVSHFIYLAERARVSLPVTQLELELQAEVDKFVLSLGFCKDSAHSVVSRLFDSPHFLDPEGSEAGERYRLAHLGRALRVARGRGQRPRARA